MTFKNAISDAGRSKILNLCVEGKRQSMFSQAVASYHLFRWPGFLDRPLQPGHRGHTPSQA